MSGRLLVLLLAVLLVGCRHARVIDSSDESERLNRVAQDRKATLVFRDGASLAVRDTRVTSDSLFWLNERTEQTGSSPLADVEQLTFRRRG